MTDKELKELVANLALSQKETDRQMKETDRKMKETDQQMKELKKKLEGIGLSIGDSSEEFFYRYFKNHPQLGQWHFQEVERNLKPRHREYDLVLINGEVVVLASIKHKLSNKDIERLHDEDIPAFRRDYPEFSKHRLYGALGAMVVGEDKENLAKKKGFFVLTQSGERVQVLSPKAKRLKAY